jgi:glycosyltransferase involved in cell wall biosynthesis
MNPKSKIINPNLKVALVADWITNPGGDDKVLWALHELYPSAPIYTTIFNGTNMPRYQKCDVRATFLQHMPFAKSKSQIYIPLMTYALSKFDFSEYDLVISSSHTIGKNITVPGNCKHICYCHTPLRYVWAPEIDDISKRIKLGPFKKPLLRRLKKQDLKYVDSVDIFIANSKTIQDRIKKAYNRDSAVIYPPVDVDKFKPRDAKKAEYYLSAGRLIPYKNTELIVRAFNKLNKKLVIAGTGPEEAKLKKIAQNNIEFLGYTPENKLIELMQKAKALMFAANEDFGIVPVEAMASGTPVIAFDKGGATETVARRKTGLFFEEQNPASIVQSVENFEIMKIQSTDCIKQSHKFSRRIFNEKILSIINSLERSQQ